MKNHYLATFCGAMLACSALAENPERVNADNATQTQGGASIRDGFTLRGTAVVMTRHGVTTGVEHEVALPNGMRVRANGNIVARDGSTTALRSNQLLTFDGETVEVALTPEGVAPVSSVASWAVTKSEMRAGARDGISVKGGQAFITREGATEKVLADVRLSNGAIVRADGTVTLANGNTIILGPDQMLDLAGVLRNARETAVPRR